MKVKSFCKSIHTLTIGEFNLYSKTHELKYLKRFRLVPSFMVDSSELITLIDAELSDGIDEQLEKEKHKLESKYKIQLLIVLYNSLVNLFTYIEDSIFWNELIGVKTDTSKVIASLEKKIEKIFELTEIKIVESDDLKHLASEITRRTDKYNEYFKENQPVKGLTFGQIILGVFSAMNMQLNYDMLMSDFLSLKESATRKDDNNG